MNADQGREQIRAAFTLLGLQLSGRQTEQLYGYYERLTETNRVMNLTAITEFSDVVNLHFLDSASLIRAIRPEGKLRVIDIGTGAGFPGVVLKILFPQLQITLLDSLNKRIEFLRRLCGELELREVEFLHGRAEDYAHREEYRETYDLCVSRAVANLSTLAEYCIPYLRTGGNFVSYKSGKIEEELARAQGAVRELGGKVRTVTEFTLPGTDICRSLITIQKVKKTGNRYPRKAGLPGREPLALTKQTGGKNE